MVARIRIGDEHRPVTVTDLSVGGMRLAPAPNLDVGKRTNLRVDDLVDDQELLIPVEVVWRREGTPSAMGVRFSGAPVVLRRLRKDALPPT